MADDALEYQLVVPVGTQIVTRAVVHVPGNDAARPRGSVGVVVEVPDELGRYKVRLPDGVETFVERHVFTIRKHAQREGLQMGDNAGAQDDLWSCIIYRCVVGSKAFGLAEDRSDIDRRGIYLPPSEWHWSLGGVPEQLENNANEEMYWELQKFLVLALKANPNVLECLYTPLIETATPLAHELLAIRSSFISQLIYQTYNGYVMSQFRQLEHDIAAKGAPKWKHVMHLIRLLLSGIAVLREGEVLVHVGEHREQLLAIRRGDTAWNEVNAWRLQLHKEFEAAFRGTHLPERPDYASANAFLIKARRSMV